jgi:hypothetical protein
MMHPFQGSKDMEKKSTGLQGVWSIKLFFYFAAQAGEMESLVDNSLGSLASKIRASYEQQPSPLMILRTLVAYLLSRISACLHILHCF